MTDYLLSLERASLVLTLPAHQVSSRSFTCSWHNSAYTGGSKTYLLADIRKRSSCLHSAEYGHSWQKVYINEQLLLFGSLFSHFSFFKGGDSVLYLGVSLHGLVWPHGQWLCLVMNFFLTDISTMMLCNNPPQTSQLVAVSIYFSPSQSCIGSGDSASDCRLPGIGSTVSWVQFHSMSFLISLGPETTWDPPATVGSYF